MKYLNARGFDCCAASVAKQGSAWDRACELYAQLTGTVTDYGKAHSERCNHDRYGTDYTGKALVSSWSAQDKINLLGHSFGGATVLMLADLMADGNAEERAASPDDVSELFTGGKADWIYSITTLAAPLNGTTAYCVDKQGNETLPEFGDDAANDCASYDMYVDNAIALNSQFQTLEGVYYFSYSCSSTVKNEDGSYSPDKSKTEMIFLRDSQAIGGFTGETAGGYAIDETWLENDGLVNTVSARAPFGAPAVDYSEGNVSSGVWNMMPVYDGDHMSLQGGFFLTNNVRALYGDLLDMINRL